MLCSRLLSIDATNEQTHRKLMQVYPDTGRAGLALRQFKVCEDALQPYALDYIKEKHGIEVIKVAYADCVKLGGNLVSLGDKRVLSMSHNVNVNRQLSEAGFEVTAIDYDMFALGGGGVHCSCHELHREPD